MFPQRPPVAISDEEFLRESLSLVESAKKEGVVLRILGGFAVYIHSNDECRRLQKKLGRLGEGKPSFTDLDLAGYNKQWKEINRFFSNSIRYPADRETNALYGGRRLVFFHPKYRYPVDVFIDKLEFSHTIDFGKPGKDGRLELDYPTLNLADLLLEKLQIHQINRKDLIDMLTLFLGHDVRDVSSVESIDGGHVARTLSDDWGFWYDACNNLGLTRKLAEQSLSEGSISENQFEVIVSRIQELISMAYSHEKTSAWKTRAKVGTSKRWFTEVSEL